jgi:hypothetical protein
LPTLDTTTRRDQVTVEAETVEEALVEVSAQLGTDAEIMRAQKVHRGGVGGFFAKEMVQLTARKRRVGGVPLRREQSRRGGIADVLERLAQDADAEDGDFRTVLQRELAAQPDEPEATAEDFIDAVGWADPSDGAGAEEPARPVPVAPVDDDAPQPVPVGPVLKPAVPVSGPETEKLIAAVAEDAAAEVSHTAPAIPIEFTEPELEALPHALPEPVDGPVAEQPEPFDAPEGMGEVNWSTTALLRIGMPGPVVAAVSALEDDSDLGWVSAIADAVAPHCGLLATDDVIVVGPHAERLAEPLGLPLVHAGDMAPYDGSFCAMIEDTAQDRAWLEFVQGGRGIHLVIGDEPWQDLLVDEPVAVSWVGERAVADALYLAFTLGATLGFGTVDGFVSSLVRVRPTDVALAIRRVVGRR